MNSDVALVYVKNYEPEAVAEALKTGLDMLGGLSSFIGKDEKVLVKPNLLVGAAPEKAVTTHPSVFGAVLRALRNDGYTDISYGDGSADPMADLSKTVKTSGLVPYAEEYDVPLADFSGPVEVDFAEGRACKKFRLCKAAAEKPAIVSVCKMKTHALENITGAVKNQYGLVYAANKAKGHALHPTSKAFADMIVDLDMCVKPRLYIMDGIMAMEGNGPGSGDPVMMNVLLISKDPVALDTVFARLVYLEPAAVPTCVSGAKAGLGTMKDSEIRVLTLDGAITTAEAASKYGKPDFNVKREKPSFWTLSMLMPRRRKYRDKPVVDASKCIACGICEKACPAEGKAVHSGGGKKAEYDYSRCIRCYCCQEMCPAGAITRESL